jgi:hypothetical protein
MNFPLKLPVEIGVNFKPALTNSAADSPRSGLAVGGNALLGGTPAT